MPQLVGKEIGPIGFGMMGLTWPHPRPEEQTFAAMRSALENGLNFWNAGEFYGPEERNSLVLLEKYFAKYPEDADKVILSVKGGALKPFRGVYDSTPENLRRSVNDCTEQLKGRKKIDIFECARHDGVTPWEVTVDTLEKEFVNTGIIKGVSLSEVRAESIHTAAKAGKICFVEVELSLMCTDPLGNGIVEACAKYDIPLIAYSPLGRGILTGNMKSFEDLPDSVKSYPRYSRENFPINLQLVEHVERLAKNKGCTPAQFAINWVRCLSKKPGMPTIIPIPGGATADRVRENSKLVDISLDEMGEIDAFLAKFEVKSARYSANIPTNQ